MSEAVLRLKPETIPVAFGDGKPVQLDPIEAFQVVFDAQDEHGTESFDAARNVREWLAGQLGIAPERIDLNAAIEFCDTIIAVANGLVEHRKKKVSETASLLLSTLGYPATTGNGQPLKKSAGSPTSPASTPTGRDLTPPTTTAASTESKPRKKKRPATAKPPKN